MIVKMKHLDLVCIAAEKEATLAQLRDLGAVHLDLASAQGAARRCIRRRPWNRGSRIAGKRPPCHRAEMADRWRGDTIRRRCTPPLSARAETAEG